MWGAAQKVREELQSWCKFVKLVVKQAKCGSEKRVSAKKSGRYAYYAPNKSLKLTLQARFLRSARPQAARCWSGRNLAQSLGASGFVGSKVATAANQFKGFFVGALAIQSFGQKIREMFWIFVGSRVLVRQ